MPPTVPPTEDLVEVRPGLRLHVLSWPGEGRAFLLVHGLASNARLWTGVARHLHAAGHRVVAVDLRGHGRSDKPDGPYDTPTVADDLAALIPAVGLHRPVAAGQSWGGNVVLDLAARHPGSVHGIALVDGGWIHLRDRFARWEDCAKRLAPPRLAGIQAARLAVVLRAAHPDWPEEGIHGTLDNMEHLPDGTIRPWLSFERHLEVLRGLWDHEPRGLYHAVAVPVLLLPAGFSAGAEGRPEVEEALDALPRARVRRYLDSDHDVHAQHPALVAQDLQSLA